MELFSFARSSLYSSAGLRFRIPLLGKNLDPVSLYWLKIPLQLFFSFNIFWPSYNIVLISQIHWLSSWKQRVGEYLWTIINNDIVNMSTPLTSVTPFFLENPEPSRRRSDSLRQAEKKNEVCKVLGQNQKLLHP